MHTPHVLVLMLLGVLAVCAAGNAEDAGDEHLLRNVAAEFAAVTRDLGDLNPVRTNLLMRLVCLRAAGITDVDYTDLVMLAGYGTSFAYHPRDFWIMYQPPDDPAQTAACLVRGTGLGWEALPKVKSAEEAWGLVKQTVDSGLPLQANYMDDYLFVGYREGEKPEDREVYTLGGWREPGWMSWQDFGKWAAEFGELSRPTKPLPREPQRVSALRVLQSIVTCAEHDGRGNVDFMKQGRFGLDGLAAYAADIADLHKTPESFDAGWCGCHAVNRQSSGRECAAEYLSRVAPLFPPQAATHLRAAALHYRAACGHWDDFGRQLGRLRPDQGQDYKAVWSEPLSRAAGARAVRDAAACEARAVTEVKLALREAGEG